MPVLPSEWVARGYHGQGNVEALLGSLTGRTAIVCGNAEGVFTELGAARAAVVDPVIFACNDVGQYVLTRPNEPPLDHWVSLHADNLGVWKAVRWLNCKNNGLTRYHSVDARPSIDYVWDRLSPCFAVSGYFAMQLAWIMGAERIILCGCPGEYRPRFFEATAREDFGYGQGTANGDDGIRAQLENEMRRQPAFKAAVRSMSGWSQSYFGGI